MPVGDGDANLVSSSPAGSPSGYRLGTPAARSGADNLRRPSVQRAEAERQTSRVGKERYLRIFRVSAELV